MQIILIVIGFCFMAYGGWKIMTYLLLNKINPNGLQLRPHINVARLYDGGYSAIAKESEGKPSLPELVQEYNELTKQESSKDEVINQRGCVDKT